MDFYDIRSGTPAWGMDEQSGTELMVPFNGSMVDFGDELDFQVITDQGELPFDHDFALQGPLAGFRYQGNTSENLDPHFGFVDCGLNQSAVDGYESTCAIPCGNDANPGNGLPSDELADMLESLRLDEPIGITQNNSSRLIPLPNSKRGDSHRVLSAETSLAPASAIKGFKRTMLPRLRALFPESAVSHSSQLTLSDLSRYNTRWLTSVGVNGCVGQYRVAPVTKAVYNYLKLPMMTLLERESRTIAEQSLLLDMPYSQPLAETFSRGAVELGDIEAVERLLRCSRFEICPNDQKIIVDNHSYTAIERAAFLQHFRLTLLLASYGADLNKSYRKPGGSFKLHRIPPSHRAQVTGAVANAIDGHDMPSSIGSSLVGALLDRGATVRSEGLKKVAATEDHVMMEVLLHGGLRQHLHEWASNRFLHAAFATLPLASLIKIVTQLLTYDFDFTERRYEFTPEILFDWCGKDHPPRLIDIASLRGFDSIVGWLLDCNAPITSDTMVAAVSSLNADLVQLLLQRVPAANAFSTHFCTTPLAESVRIRSHDIYSMLSKLSDTMAMDRDSKTALLIAAAEAGDMVIVSRLTRPQSHCGVEAMGYALFAAVTADQTDSAVVLLEAGATTDPKEFNRSAFNLHGRELMNMRPLKAAVAHRNKALVRKLLDHNVCWSDCLAPAVEWGDRAVISDLLFARTCLSPLVFRKTEADEAEALAAAVRARDLGLLRQLLEHGLLVYASSPSAHRNSAAAVSVQLNETEMLSMIVAFWPSQLGPALACAVEYDKLKVFDLLEPTITTARPQEIGRLTRHAICLAIRENKSDFVRRIINLGGDYGGDDRTYANEVCHVRFFFFPLAEAIRKDQGQDLNMVKLVLRAKHGSIDRCLKMHPCDENLGEPADHRSISLNALLLAITTGNVDMVALIISCGANVNLPAFRGVRRTPLQEAVVCGHHDIVSLLIASGADVNGKPCQRAGRTAFQYAASAGFIGLAQLLIRHGADIRAPGASVNGRTSIEAAAEDGRFDMVTYLLRLGDWPEGQLEKSSRYAADNGHNAVANLVQSALVLTRDQSMTNWDTSPLHMTAQYGAEQSSRIEEILEPDSVLCERAMSTDFMPVAQLPQIPDQAMEHEFVAPTQQRADESQEVCGTSSSCAFELNPQFELRSQATKENVSEDPAPLMHDHLPLERADFLTPTATVRHRYFCNTCRRPFSNSSALKRHLRTKHKTRNDTMQFNCDFCDKKTARKDTMKRHQATHNKEGYLDCESCGGKFRRDYLRVHAELCSARL
ncbi:unnamed protein product [Zymoseptoria tritici ST99CH_1E4]|uniref:C2H2-type domain-containing protein n=1 Tax=Zymoseptoria tritici ST99CH_1E4 TaxID=1276532 RepID=A0A2H1H5Q2_ZYMTR|nr:unnamed protein product [Zymoseptoria tritici ST99CH_1E4]